MNSNKSESVDNLVLNGVLKLLDSTNYSWIGTMTELNRVLAKKLGNQSKYLPKSPSALRVVLNRVVNRLRNRKVSVKFARTTDHVRTRYVTFTR